MWAQQRVHRHLKQAPRAPEYTGLYLIVYLRSIEKQVNPAKGVTQHSMSKITTCSSTLHARQLCIKCRSAYVWPPLSLFSVCNISNGGLTKSRF